MTLSLLCFYVGYFFRTRDNLLHQRVNLLGVVFNLAAAIYLLLIKYAFGGLSAFSIFPAAERWVIDTHRAFAALSLLMMLAMAFTGLRRKRTVHTAMHWVFLPLYTLVLISGFFFSNLPHPVHNPEEFHEPN